MTLDLFFPEIPFVGHYDLGVGAQKLEILRIGRDLRFQLFKVLV